MPLDLHANQERIRPQLEQLATLARDGNKRAREELTGMGIVWRDATPAASANHDETKRRASSMRSLVVGVSRFERRVVRGLVLAILSALTVRYVAWSLAVAVAYLRHGAS